MANLLWLQGGACSGNTMSFLNAQHPSVCDLVTDFGIHILWHPSLGMERGPMTHSPCNRILCNRQSSKTRAGMPCLGCTEPEFPFYDLAPGTGFKTQTVMGIPNDLPEGIDQRAYIKLTSAAKAVSPSWAEDDCFVV